jgi:hypothetical protein
MESVCGLALALILAASGPLSPPEIMWRYYWVDSNELMVVQMDARNAPP